MKKRASIIVRGQVQGVGFRVFIRDRARQLALTGWVRNRADGSIEVVAEGEHKRLQQLVVLCNNGPPEAIVQDMTVEWQEPSEEFPMFIIR
jgi:acylphosphatase